VPFMLGVLFHIVILIVIMLSVMVPEIDVSGFQIELDEDFGLHHYGNRCVQPHKTLTEGEGSALLTSSLR
jgi:hypothetical protein